MVSKQNVKVKSHTIQALCLAEIKAKPGFEANRKPLHPVLQIYCIGPTNNIVKLTWIVLETAAVQVWF